MIEVKNLYKSFGEQTVLNGINCIFEPGVNNLIIGQSGSGKTVLLKCLIGLHKPEQGEILYDGRDITKLKDKEMKEIRKEIGVLFQGSALFDSMSVEENVAFPLRMFSDKTVAEIRERVDFCLERVGLKGAHQKMPSELSGGMQKRVAILWRYAEACRHRPCHLTQPQIPLLRRAQLGSRPADLHSHRPAHRRHYTRV